MRFIRKNLTLRQNLKKYISGFTIRKEHCLIGLKNDLNPLTGISKSKAKLAIIGAKTLTYEEREKQTNNRIYRYRG